MTKHGVNTFVQEAREWLGNNCDVADSFKDGFNKALVLYEEATRAEARLAAATTVTDEDVETVSRALCLSDGLDPDFDYDPKGLSAGIGVRWTCYAPKARAALTAFVASKQAGAGEGENQEGGDANCRDKMMRSEPAPQSDDQACGADALKVIREMAAALEPFARIGAGFKRLGVDHDDLDHLDADTKVLRGNNSVATMGDLRNAAAILTNPLVVAARKGGGE